MTELFVRHLKLDPASWPRVKLLIIELLAQKTLKIIRKRGGSVSEVEVF